ncbi:hypothetical protein JCM19239_3160 [Vibrio variabilis]|uniref:Uncharacterized protein n=1 Tax=Vibrio variabilis TaxID=990271 RepID=A0ABQ0JR94_9VIBR|nr:hypothetical protein JCM19239_3160 [Vibrio variabilis]
MFDLLKKVVLINLSAALVVIVLAQFVPFFATTQLVDFLFLCCHCYMGFGEAYVGRWYP